jgi:hypothetical protein
MNLVGIAGDDFDTRVARPSRRTLNQRALPDQLIQLPVACSIAARHRLLRLDLRSPPNGDRFRRERRGHGIRSACLMAL